MKYIFYFNASLNELRTHWEESNPEEHQQDGVKWNWHPWKYTGQDKAMPRHK